MAIFPYRRSRAHFAAGEEIHTHGDIGRWLYIVGKGKVRIRAADGREVAVLQKGDVFGEISLSSDEPLTTTAQTLTKVDALRISSGAFEHLLHHSEKLRKSVEQLGTERITPNLAGTSEAPMKAEAWAEARTATIASTFFISISDSLC